MWISTLQEFSVEDMQKLLNHCDPQCQTAVLFTSSMQQILQKAVSNESTYIY